MSSGLALFVAPVKDGDGLESLIKIVFFLVVIVGPPIVKAIRESARKKKELAESATRRMATEETRAEAAPELEQDEAVPEGNDWERLLRGEAEPPPAPVVPPPLPTASLERAPRRRVLTETRSFEDEALAEPPPLTGSAAAEVATPERSLEDPVGYDGVNRPKLGVGREFAEFAPQEGLASDREGGPARRVGQSATFAGAGAFQSLSTAGAQSEVSQREIGGDKDFDVTAGHVRGGRHLLRADLRRSLLLAEILGPPVGVRPFESGPTRPLGWS